MNILKSIFSFIGDVCVWFCITMLVIVIYAVVNIFPNLAVISLIVGLIITTAIRLINIVCKKEKENSNKDS